MSRLTWFLILYRPYKDGANIFIIHCYTDEFMNFERNVASIKHSMYHGSEVLKCWGLDLIWDTVHQLCRGRSNHDTWILALFSPSKMSFRSQQHLSAVYLICTLYQEDEFLALDALSSSCILWCVLPQREANTPDLWRGTGVPNRSRVYTTVSKHKSKRYASIWPQFKYQVY